MAHDDADATDFPDAPEMQTLELDDVLRPQPRQRRIWSMVALGLALIVAVVALVRTYLPQNGAHGVASIRASIQNPLYQLDTNVTYGTLILNGAKQPMALRNTLGLHDGVNILTLVADPFTPKSCAITLPLRLGFASSPAPNKKPHACGLLSYGDSEAIFGLFFMVDDLTPALRDQAIASLSQAATQVSAPLTTTVRPGEHYATGYAADGAPVASVATQPVPAQLQITVGDGTLCLPCDPAATINLADLHPRQPYWLYAPQPQFTWRFTTPDGIIALDVPQADAAYYVGEAPILALTYAHSEWQAAPTSAYSDDFHTTPATNYRHALCAAGDTLLSGLITRPQYGGGAADGAFPQPCSIGVQYDNTSEHQTRYYYLFGALVAADPQGHEFLPQVPLATDQDLSLAASTR